MNSKKMILAFVGMPGAGKTEAVSYLEGRGIPFIRFGDLTDEGVKELGLPLTPDNEQMFREKIRKELGMAAYAIKAEPKINKLLDENDVVAIEGLRSWEEYIYLINKFENLKVIAIYAEPELRYKRLTERKVRPVVPSESRKRDIAELQNLNMGNSIAISDYLIVNDETISALHERLDTLLGRLNIR